MSGGKATQCVCASLIAALLLISCGPGEKPADRAPIVEPVVVYADFGGDDLSEFFRSFTDSSGIRVVVYESDEAVDSVVANSGSPPADVLLTRDITGIWRAADEGALRPIDSGALAGRVPDGLRDPDGYWVAIGPRTSLLVYDNRESGFVPPTSYEDLADERYHGQLCLSLSSDSANQTVIAMLINELGVRPAEMVVRGWMANLAVPVFATEAELIRALRSTMCQMGLVSSKAVATMADSTAAVLQPADFGVLFANAEGVGIARHARHPDAAAELIEWWLAEQPQADYVARTHSVSVFDADGLSDVSNSNVSTIGWLSIDAAKLAERAGYK